MSTDFAGWVWKERRDASWFTVVCIRVWVTHKVLFDDGGNEVWDQFKRLHVIHAWQLLDILEFGADDGFTVAFLGSD